MNSSCLALGNCEFLMTGSGPFEFLVIGSWALEFLVIGAERGVSPQTGLQTFHGKCFRHLTARGGGQEQSSELNRQRREGEKTTVRLLESGKTLREHCTADYTHSSSDEETTTCRPSVSPAESLRLSDVGDLAVIRRQL